jgi:cytosine/uracil/thiamine/allantoin permease
MNIENSPLYSPDLAPVPEAKRTWNKWNLAALWIGMAVCIPTYLLASYMIRSGLSWIASLLIIGLANLVITLPMVLNGHAGVKYGLPFPVIGRSAFGIKGIHLVSMVRGLVACGWFGIQTWVGGLAILSIINVHTGSSGPQELLKFLCFGIFWLINMYFVWNGTESIRKLEDWSAPILILIGILLIFWGYQQGGGISPVLECGKQLQQKTVLAFDSADKSWLRLNLLRDKNGTYRAEEFCLKQGDQISEWAPLPPALLMENPQKKDEVIQVKFRSKLGESSWIQPEKMAGKGSILWSYILWFTAMVGFWATMSISISDITRFAKSQGDQIAGQFMGLPGTMLFYSFTGIFVTFASLLAFPDVLVAEDAPWDPVNLVARFSNPWVVVFAQISMLIATLSTNIAANIIAPAYAISNLAPGKISFRIGGVMAGFIGILTCPWWLLNEISGVLLFVSGLLGPVLGILLCDYFVIRRTQLPVEDLFNPQGSFNFGGDGINRKAMISMAAGVLAALIGYWVPAIGFLFSLSWFTGFAVSFILYGLWMPRQAGRL